MPRSHDRVNSKMHRCKVDPTGRILAITYGGFVGPQEVLWSIIWHHAPALGQIQNLGPHRLMSRLKSNTTPGNTLRTRPYLLSTPGSKRWMSMVMANDEDSDFVANDAEQEVIREPPLIRSPAKEKSLPGKSAMALPTKPLPGVKS